MKTQTKLRKKTLTHIAAPVNKNSKKAVNNPVFINNLYWLKNLITDNQLVTN